MKTKLNPGALSLATNPMRPMFGMPRFFHDTAGDGGGSAGAGGGTGAGGQGGQGGQGGDGGQGGVGMIQMTQERFDELMEGRVIQERRQWESKEKEWGTKLKDLETRLNKQFPSKDGKPADGEKVYTQADLQGLLAEKESAKDQEYKPKIDEYEARITALLEKEKTGAIVSAAARAKAIDPEDVAHLVSRYISHDENNDLVVLGENGKPRLNTNASPMTVDEFVKQFLDQKPHLKQASNSGGAGSSTKTVTGAYQQQTQRPKSIRDAAMQFGQEMISK